MRKPELPSHFKPLYANLLRLGLPNFFLTSTFEYLMIENNWDQCWDICLEEAYKRSNVFISGGYLGYVEDALGFFIRVAGPGEPETLFSFIHKILKIFLKDINNSPDLTALRSALLTARYPEEKVDSLITELQTITPSVTATQKETDQIEDLTTIPVEINSFVADKALEQVIQLCTRLHVVASQFRRRHDSRSTLDVNDEYDVQDLLHGLLRIFFDDVRPEEYTPSHASKATRMDFLLKREEIVIEVKMTRKGLSDKEVADQLILDIQRYRSHQNCKTLVCFIYDPEARIANPSGLRTDLSGNKEGLKVVLLIEPKPL
jgi:hypothetical protein